MTDELKAARTEGFQTCIDLLHYCGTTRWEELDKTENKILDEHKRTGKKVSARKRETLNECRLRKDELERLLGTLQGHIEKIPQEVQPLNDESDNKQTGESNE